MSEMRLSEAIRLGAMATKPADVCEAFRRDGNGRVCATCAIAAASFAVNILDARGWNLLSGRWGGAIADRFPLLNVKAEAPIRIYMGEANVGQVASILFQKGWTREQIADWIETIERRADADNGAQEQAVAPAVALCAPK